MLITTNSPAPHSFSLIQKIEENATGLSGSRIALIEKSGKSVTFSELWSRICLSAKKYISDDLIFFFLTPDIDAIIEYLSVLSSGSNIAILANSIPQKAFNDLLIAYKPTKTIGKTELLSNYFSQFEFSRLGIVSIEHDAKRARIANKHQTLLGTSGSTGSPKMVRLSSRAISSNASDIVNALKITESDRGMTVLPLSYTYGLSVLHSHLWAGASVLCSELTAIDKGFREAIDDHKVTNLAGVPFTYSIYKKIGLISSPPKSITTFTQAGGALSPHLVKEIGESLARQNVSFYVMYGQTEATARMAILPAEDVIEKYESVGKPVESGSISIGSDNSPDEIVFEGPNVMLGYAEKFEDLDLGDLQNGILHTGDLGRLENNYLYITGRLKRLAKINGVRVNLQEIEQKIQKLISVVVVEGDNKMLIFTTEASERIQLIGDLLADEGFLQRDYQIHQISEFPTLSSGKIDYQALKNAN